MGNRVRYSPQLAGEIISIGRRAGAWDGEFVAIVRWNFPDRQSYESGEMDFAWLTLDEPRVDPREGGRLVLGDWVRNREWGWEGFVVHAEESRHYGQLVEIDIRYRTDGDTSRGRSILLCATAFEHAESKALV